MFSPYFLTRIIIGCILHLLANDSSDCVIMDKICLLNIGVLLFAALINCIAPLPKGFNMEPRYCAYKSLTSNWIYVMPAERNPYPNCELLKLGLVTNFSRDAIISFAELNARILGRRVVYINMETHQ